MVATCPKKMTSALSGGSQAKAFLALMWRITNQRSSPLKLAMAGLVNSRTAESLSGGLAASLFFRLRLFFIIELPDRRALRPGLKNREVGLNALDLIAGDVGRARDLP